jgi:predicted DNA-binding protein (MmcQ/YjbR family)
MAGKDINSAVREVCLSLPAAEEVMSRGSPDFRVEGKTFATYCVNHHGDGRVALWLHSPAGAQDLYTEMEPEYYFVPPYVGPRGWLGVELNKGLNWSTIATRVREAYEHVAPGSMSANIGDTISIVPPDLEMRPEEINPFLGTRAQQVLNRLGALCEALPETSAGSAFGNPVWKAGKKTFVSTHYYSQRLCLQFWVGAEQQAMLCYDDRYAIPAYMGHNGWIELDVEDDADWREIEQLLLTSYRHFALRRMLKALDGT